MVIYKIINNINGKTYIGQTVRSLSQRVADHLVSKSYIGNSLRKYGIESFSITVIDHADTREVLNEKERHWIKILNCKHPNGYNLTYGGEGLLGYSHSEETRKKISDSKQNVSAETACRRFCRSYAPILQWHPRLVSNQLS